MKQIRLDDRITLKYTEQVVHNSIGSLKGCTGLYRFIKIVNNKPDIGSDLIYLYQYEVVVTIDRVLKAFRRADVDLLKLDIQVLAELGIATEVTLSELKAKGLSCLRTKAETLDSKKFNFTVEKENLAILSETVRKHKVNYDFVLNTMITNCNMETLEDAILTRLKILYSNLLEYITNNNTLNGYKYSNFKLDKFKGRDVNLELYNENSKVDYSVKVDLLKLSEYVFCISK